MLHTTVVGCNALRGLVSAAVVVAVQVVGHHLTTLWGQSFRLAASFGALCIRAKLAYMRLSRPFSSSCHDFTYIKKLETTDVWTYEMRDSNVLESQYTDDSRHEAVRLGQSVGLHEAARHLGVPVATLGGGKKALPQLQGETAASAAGLPARR